MKEPKIILITGASSGLGKALAEAYAVPGATLLLTGRDEERLAEITRRCSERGATVISKAFDIRNKDAAAAWLKSIDETHPIDLVIANAGISGGTGGQGVNSGETADQTRNIFDTNVNGVLNIVLPLIPSFQQRKRGQIAIMSSLASFRGLPGAPAYSASKAAIRFWGEALRGALQPDGIEVNVICPSYIKTPMTDANRFPMPFIMSAGKAAGIIKAGLEKNRARIAFPLLPYLVIYWLGSLPPWLTDPLFSRLPKK